MNFAVATGDWNLRGRDADQAFAQVVLSDTCIDAANRASRNYGLMFPAWELYCRVLRGDTMFDRKLRAWSILGGRAYARARQINGHPVVAKRARRNEWIAQASVDALHFVIHGKFDEAAHVAAGRLDVWTPSYRRVRDAVSSMMLFGFDSYRAELHYQYWKVLREERNVIPTTGNRHVILGLRGSVYPSMDFTVGEGNYYAAPTETD